MVNPGNVVIPKACGGAGREVGFTESQLSAHCKLMP